ncbi:hypothetical protein MMC08_009146, partial [Hypocenomyce scalaris]|nr:hypothetical protein [Hypocenomyce scalaris]
MERSQCFPSIQHSKPSTDGQLIATLLQSRLLLRLSSNGEIVRTIPLDNGFSTRCRYLRWSRDNGTVEEGQEHLGSGAPARVHLLLADDDTVRVYNAYDTQWSAVITGASSNFGKIANVEFGNTADEILIFSDFGVKATLWSLITSRGSEIRDPKFTNKGYSYRPETGHLTILTRPTAHDVVMLLAPSTYELLCSFTLATVDAQGLVWSPDGKWLVTWDAASSGYKVLVYTADGHLYRTVTGGQDANKIGLGIKAVAWSAAGAYLAVGGYDGRLALLNATTFSPRVVFEHTTTIDLPGTSIWQEQIAASKERNYVTASPLVCPPTTPSQSADSTPKTGISTFFFNSDGTYLVTRCDSTPTTVWIWSMETFAPAAILIHHSATKNIQWHPTISGLLLIQCTTEESVLHIWHTDWETPRIITMPLEKPGGKLQATWLQTTVEDKPRLMLGN